jgi:hypothetical protein
MKKNKILILTLIVQLMFIGAAQAKCDLESFKFGSSYKSLMSKLKMDGDFMEPKIEGISERFFLAPGELVCKNEKIFESVPVNFVFLYDDLVEIHITRLSEEATLVDWAESIYGEKKDKPRSFFYQQPYAQWLWVNSNATIAYSIESNENEVFESIIIQSFNHQKIFEKLAIEQEGE